MLSIIIPALNEKPWLPRLLDSIKKQNYRNYEVIVADAGSTDGTVELAEKYKARVVKGGLPGTGRNNGAKVAKGDILLFLDADTELPDDFLTGTIKEFTDNNLDIATCLIDPLSDSKIDIVLHKIANYYIDMTQRIYPHAPGFCILVKKSMHDKIGGFNEQLKLAEDHDYVRRAAKIGNFRILYSEKIRVSVRRLDKDGRLNVSVKYFSVELYRILKGEIKTNIFSYKFGHEPPKTED